MGKCAIRKGCGLAGQVSSGDERHEAGGLAFMVSIFITCKMSNLPSLHNLDFISAGNIT